MKTPMEKLLSFLKQPSIISAVVIIIFTIVWDIWRNKPKLKFKGISIHKGIKEWIMEVHVVNNGNKPISNIYTSVDIKDLFKKQRKNMNKIWVFVNYMCARVLPEEWHFGIGPTHWIQAEKEVCTLEWKIMKLGKLLKKKGYFLLK